MTQEEKIRMDKIINALKELYDYTDGHKDLKEYLLFSVLHENARLALEEYKRITNNTQQ